jgi:hypothetical protein
VIRRQNGSILPVFSWVSLIESLVIRTRDVINHGTEDDILKPDIYQTKGSSNPPLKVFELD